MTLTPETLKARRMRLGLSQAELGFALGLTGPRVNVGRTVRRWEAGERDMPPTLALALLALENGLSAQG